MHIIWLSAKGFLVSEVAYELFIRNLAFEGKNSERSYLAVYVSMYFEVHTLLCIYYMYMYVYSR